MKKIFALSIILSLFVSILVAQSPGLLNYQAIVRDDEGNALKSQAVSLRISILQGDMYGTTVYCETHATTTNQYGMVTLEIGNGTILTGTFNAIDWSNGPYFMKVDMDPSGGSSYTDMGTTQILSVPYALHSKTAKEYAETDPVFGAHVTSGITSGDLSNWNSAYGWGDHSAAGYLTSFTEADPVFGGHVASGITSTDLTHWNNAYGWGDHSAAGYLTGYTETDPVFGGHVSNGITGSNIANWNAAYNWGNHATAGYGLLAAPNIWMEDQIISHPASPRLIIQDMGDLQSFVEFHNSAQINGYIVFNHAAHNLYLGNQASGPKFEWIFSGDGRLIAPGDVESGGLIHDLGGHSGQWNAAFHWGDHALAGYLTANSTLNGLVESTAPGNSYFTGGNVGIGTSTPMEKLHVLGNLRVENNIHVMGTIMANDVNATGGGNFFNLTSSNSFASPAGSINELFASTFINTPHAIVGDLLEVGGTTFMVSGGGNLAYNVDKFVATSSGNVGIGTATPTENLSVEGVVQSISGGFMFPDATIQKTAAPEIKHGTNGYGISVGPYSYNIVVVSFGDTFSSLPTVTVTGANVAGDPANHLLPSVVNPTPTGFTLVVYNTSSMSYSGTYMFNWIAVGN